MTKRDQKSGAGWELNMTGIAISLFWTDRFSWLRRRETLQFRDRTLAFQDSCKSHVERAMTSSTLSLH
jgi:hypothetical protein